MGKQGRYDGIRKIHVYVEGGETGYDGISKVQVYVEGGRQDMMA